MDVVVNEKGGNMSLVSFDICKGNPGALTFLMKAYDLDPFAAERAFSRMRDAGIEGSWLYMIWNDCCNRDTRKAIRAMIEIDIEVIKDHVFRPRGIPFEEMEEGTAKGGHHESLEIYRRQAGKSETE